MVRAVLENGVIRPVEPLPPEWREGQELVVETGGRAHSDDADDRWAKEFVEATQAITDEDHDRLMAAIEEHKRESKEWVRRAWGLE